jgi:hypothetical protein
LRRFLLLALAVSVLSGAPLALLVFDTHFAAPGHLPDGWRLRANRGTPEVTVINEGAEHVLHLRSRASSFALERGLDVDPAQLPVLSWRWKVAELPRGGDFRHYATDDQAAQVIVAFGDRKVLTYLWDTSAPQGTAQSATGVPLLHIFAFVCRSGASEANQWITETRNLAQDFQRAYGHFPKEHVKGIRLQINSQHTGTGAESYFGEVGFRAAR